MGNSSSGIIEAASLELPVVDIGERQRGRLRLANVLRVGEREEEIAEGIREALTLSFRKRLSGLVNPYGDGRASQRIVRAILEAPLDRLKRKPLVEPAIPASDLRSLTLPCGSNLKEAMTAIQRGRAGIAFVVDPEGLLVGSVSDGDVGRAVLDGAGMEDLIDPCVNRVPVIATPRDGTADIISLMERNGVSLVDREGRLRAVHLMRPLVSQVLDPQALEANW